MPYTDHFRLTDDLIAHLDPILLSLKDPFVESRYTGFLAVSAVTVLELAMKSIFCDFAVAKHKVLGNFTYSYFERINGRIGLKLMMEDYAPRFGPQYAPRFARRVRLLEESTLRAERYSIKASYGNLISWRNDFAHEGILPANATYAEVKRGYASGRQIMDCLFASMRR